MLLSSAGYAKLSIKPTKPSCPAKLELGLSLAMHSLFFLDTNNLMHVATIDPLKSSLMGVMQLSESVSLKIVKLTIE